MSWAFNVLPFASRRHGANVKLSNDRATLIALNVHDATGNGDGEYFDSI